MSESRRKKKNPNEGHRSRMRKRFRNVGLSGFAPHEIIEFILFFSIPRIDTNKKAHRLIERFGSVSGVLDTDARLLRDEGLSDKSIALFRFITGIMPLYYAPTPDEIRYDNPIRLKACIEDFFAQKSCGTVAALLRQRFSTQLCG